MASIAICGYAWQNNDVARSESSVSLTTYVCECPAGTYCSGDLTAANVHNAVAFLFFDPAAAQGTYGPIASWHTAGVTSFEYLFCGIDDSDCGTANTLGVLIERATLPWAIVHIFFLPQLLISL